MFYLAQLSGLLAWLCLLLSYYRKNTKKILFIQIISILFYLLNYLLLGAWTGLIIVVFELLRDSLYYKTDKDDLIFKLTIPFYIILAILSRNNLIELIPILASLIEGFTLTKSKKTVVPGAILVYTMWVFYDIFVKAYTGALTDGLIVLSNIFILYNMITGYKRVNEFVVITRCTINKKVLNILNELDEEFYEEHLLWDNEYQKETYEKYKKSLIFIKHKEDIIGYINMLPIKMEEYLSIISKHEITTKYEKLGTEESRYYIVDSIVLKEKYQNELSVKLFSKALKNHINKIKPKDIISIAVNDFEEKVLKSTQFKKLKEIDKNILYIYSGGKNEQRKTKTTKK